MSVHPINPNSSPNKQDNVTPFAKKPPIGPIPKELQNSKTAIEISKTTEAFNSQRSSFVQTPAAAGLSLNITNQADPNDPNKGGGTPGKVAKVTVVDQNTTPPSVGNIPIIPPRGQPKLQLTNTKTKDPTSPNLDESDLEINKLVGDKNKHKPSSIKEGQVAPESSHNITPKSSPSNTPQSFLSCLPTVSNIFYRGMSYLMQQGMSCLKARDSKIAITNTPNNDAANLKSRSSPDAKSPVNLASPQGSTKSRFPSIKSPLSSTREESYLFRNLRSPFSPTPSQLTPSSNNHTVAFTEEFENYSGLKRSEKINTIEKCIEALEQEDAILSEKKRDESSSPEIRDQKNTLLREINREIHFLYNHLETILDTFDPNEKEPNQIKQMNRIQILQQKLVTLDLLSRFTLAHHYKEEYQAKSPLEKIQTIQTDLKTLKQEEENLSAKKWLTMPMDLQHQKDSLLIEIDGLSYYLQDLSRSLKTSNHPLRAEVLTLKEELNELKFLTEHTSSYAKEFSGDYSSLPCWEKIECIKKCSLLLKNRQDQLDLCIKREAATSDTQNQINADLTYLSIQLRKTPSIMQGLHQEIQNIKSIREKRDLLENSLPGLSNTLKQIRQYQIAQINVLLTEELLGIQNLLNILENPDPKLIQKEKAISRQVSSPVNDLYSDVLRAETPLSTGSSPSILQEIKQLKTAVINEAALSLKQTPSNNWKLLKDHTEKSLASSQEKLNQEEYLLSEALAPLDNTSINPYSLRNRILRNLPDPTYKNIVLSLLNKEKPIETYPYEVLEQLYEAFSRTENS